MSLARLVRGVAALSVSAAPRPALLVAARAASSQATAEMPANIVFAEEKPVRAPRVVAAAQKGAALYGE